jgi:hypothetical protein
MGNEMATSGQMGAPAPVVQRQSDTATVRKTGTRQAGQNPAADRADASPQQGGESTPAQFTDWASI